MNKILNKISDQFVFLNLKKISYGNLKLIDSDVDLSGSFESPVLGGSLSFNNGFINFNSTNQNNKKENNLIRKEDKKDWPELYWNNNDNIEIIQ